MTNERRVHEWEEIDGNPTSPARTKYLLQLIEEAEERGRIAERIRIANAANEMGLGYPSMKAGAALLAFAERIRTGQA